MARQIEAFRKMGDEAGVALPDELEALLVLDRHAGYLRPSQNVTCHKSASSCCSTAGEAGARWGRGITMLAWAVQYCCRPCWASAIARNGVSTSPLNHLRHADRHYVAAGLAGHQKLRGHFSSAVRRSSK
jgi:hypothetical protein